MVGCSGDTTTTSTTAVAKSAYDEILSQAGITHTSTVTGDKMVSFARRNDDGVEVHDYGYNNEGVVCEIIETIYMPFGDTYSPEYADTLDGVMAEEYARFDSIDCASVGSRFVDNVYILTIKYTGLDNLDNVRALHDAGVFNEAYSYYNMSDAEAEMLGKGYVKK